MQKAFSLLPDRRSFHLDVARRRTLYAALLTAVAYYAGAVLGLALTFQPRPVSVLWFPNAILLAAFILTPPRCWRVLLGAAFVAHVAVQLPAGIPVPMMLCWFVSNSLEGLIGALLVRRYAAPPWRLDRFGNVAVFVTVVLFATLLSSFLDAGFVRLNGWGSSGFWTVFQARLCSNLLAELTVIPAILGLGALDWRGFRDAARIRYVEGGLLAAGLLAVSLLIFGGQMVGPARIPALLYVPLPFLLWASVRFGPAGASAAVLVTVLIATWNAVHGRGPFTTFSAASNALQIQLLFSVAAVTHMSVAAVLEERRRAQAALRRKSELLRLAVDAAQMQPWDWPVPPDLPAAFGTDAAGANGGSLLEPHLGRIHPADRRNVMESIVKAVRDRGRLELQFRIAQPHGDVRWMRGVGKVLRDENDRPMRVVGLFADVTERRIAEALNEGESRILEMIAAGAPVHAILTSLVRLIEAESLGLLCSVLILDRDGVHAYHVAAPSLPASYVRAIDGFEIGPGAGACGTSMYERRPVLTMDIRDDPLWDAHRDTALRHGLRACWSTPILADDGGVLGSFAMYYRYPRRPSPREVQLVEIATQVAAIALSRHRAEVESNEQRRVLAHLGRVAVLGELSGALAHELSQPLTSILSDAQTASRIIARGGDDGERLREIVDSIVAADRRAADVIDRLRTLLRDRSPQLVELDVNVVTGDTIELARTDIAVRGIVLNTTFTPSLPSVLGDRIQIQQVLLNLVLNACDAMTSNAHAARDLAIATRVAEDGTVEVSVADRGTGIPEGANDRIFEPFFTSKDHGLGLGLSICRTIVGAHRGRLTASNNADGGATFRLRLPTADSANAPRLAASLARDLVGWSRP